MDEKVPGHLNGLFLKIVPEGEVSQHLKEGMVPGCLSHNLQIVMFSSGTNTFLGGSGSLIVPGLFG